MKYIDLQSSITEEKTGLEEKVFPRLSRGNRLQKRRLYRYYCKEMGFVSLTSTTAYLIKSNKEYYLLSAKLGLPCLSVFDSNM